MMELGPAVPILRIFDEQQARTFYVSYLGFAVDFEHRFDASAPLYLAISSGGCELHLSQHYGDSSPGAQVRISIRDLSAYHSGLVGKQHPNCRPGIEQMPWGTSEMRLTDPFGNRLTFFQRPL
jgi:uncharacterized glyoxalase superfamily protein PhnB